MKYNKANLNSAAFAAMKASRSDGRLRYVFATVYGYQISKRKPEVPQSFFIIGPSTWALASYDLESGKYIWTQPKSHSHASLMDEGPY